MSSNATSPLSALNAVKHGLLSQAPVLPGEDRAEWDKFQQDVVSELAPVGVLEREMAERVALQMWRLRRAARYEAEVASDECLHAGHDAVSAAIGLDPTHPVDDQIKALLSEQRAGERLLRLGEAARDLVTQLPTLPGQTMIPADVAGSLLSVDGDPRPELAERDLTADELREELVETFAMPIAALLVWAKVEAEKRCVRLAKEVTLRRRRAEHAAEVHLHNSQASVNDRCLLRKETLERVVRYEAHVSRQLKQALAMLREFQAERRGRETVPPVMPLPVPPPPPVASTSSPPLPVAEAVEVPAAVRERVEASSFGNFSESAPVGGSPTIPLRMNGVPKPKNTGPERRV